MNLKAVLPGAVMLAQVAMSLPAPQSHPSGLIARGIETLNAIKARGWNDWADSEDYKKRNVEAPVDKRGWNDWADSEDYKKRNVEAPVDKRGWNDWADSEDFKKRSVEAPVLDRQ